jgi:hypothetical protein
MGPGRLIMAYEKCRTNQCGDVPKHGVSMLAVRQRDGMACFLNGEGAGVVVTELDRTLLVCNVYPLSDSWTLFCPSALTSAHSLTHSCIHHHQRLPAAHTLEDL